jgi:hypothetical protein
MQEFTLPRTGKSNLTFTGELIAQAKSPAHRRYEHNPKGRAHWFEAAVYRTKGGKYILSVAYRWAGKMSREENMDFVWPLGNTQDVYATLAEFDPTECVSGYPIGEFWTQKQESLLESIRQDFDILAELIETKVEQQTQEPERVE